MKNNLLPVALLLGGGFYLFRWLRNKQDAGANLKYEPVDIAIDTERSQAANFFQIYYKVKIRLINDGRASVNVRDIDLVASAGNTRISNITSSTQFVVPANSSKVIQLTASISTAGIVNTLLNIIEDGLNIPITVTGQILTDLGTLNITFTKVIGAPTMNGTNDNDLIGQYIQSDFRKEIGIIKSIEGDFVTITYPSLGFTESVNYKLVPLTIINHKRFTN